MLFKVFAFLFIPEVQNEADTYASRQFFSPSLLILFCCLLHHPSPLPPSLGLVLHSPPTPTKSLFTQSSHLSLSLLLPRKWIRSLYQLFVLSFFLCSFVQICYFIGSGYKSAKNGKSGYGFIYFDLRLFILLQVTRCAIHTFASYYM